MKFFTSSFVIGFCFLVFIVSISDAPYHAIFWLVIGGIAVYCRFKYSPQKSQNNEVVISPVSTLSTVKVPMNSAKTREIKFAFTCKNCGAPNPESTTGICDFCGSAAPADLKTAALKEVIARNPPATENGNNDDTLRVSPHGIMCSTCGYVSTVEYQLPGSAVIEIILYLFYLLPGIIYSVWRRTDSNKIAVCPKCGGRSISNIMSAEGHMSFKRFYGKTPKI